MRRVPLAVVGCGIVAQARYFPLLHRLHDLFDVRAVCDPDTVALQGAIAWFPTASAHEQYTEAVPDISASGGAALLLAGDEHAGHLETCAASPTSGCPVPSCCDAQRRPSTREQPPPQSCSAHTRT